MNKLLKLQEDIQDFSEMSIDMTNPDTFKKSIDFAKNVMISDINRKFLEFEKKYEQLTGVTVPNQYTS